MIKTTGIVIKSINVGDYNKMLNVLSPELGKISVWAIGVRSAKNKNSGGCALLSYNEFILKQKGDTYTLTECTVLESFYYLRESVEKLAYSMYFAELAGLVCDEGLGAEDILKLLLNSLYYLEHNKKDPADLKVMFEMRLMCCSGFMPVVSDCAVCGGDPVWFESAKGGMVCDDCKSGSAKHISPEALGAMNLYCTANLKSALEYDGKTISEELSPISEDYAAMYIGKIPKTLAYLKSVI